MTRSAADAPHPDYPLPGIERGTIALEEGDGETQTYPVGEFLVEVFDGKKRWQTTWGQDLNATLLVTATRVAFASTKMLKAFSAKDLSFVGQIRYEQLGGIVGGIKPMAALRFVVPGPGTPDDPGILFIVTFRQMGRRWDTEVLAKYIAQRAALHRQALAGDADAGFEVVPHEKSGKACIAHAPDSRWQSAIRELSTKRLGIYG